jgi:hypothetical protein
MNEYMSINLAFGLRLGSLGRWGVQVTTIGDSPMSIAFSLSSVLST